MPFYCYTNDAGRTIERSFAFGQAPRRITWERDVFHRDVAAEHRDQRSGGADWPILSDGAGVHPDQIPEAEAYNKQVGLGTKYCPGTGRAEFDSPGHRRKHLKKWGLHDNDGFD